jgi:hypothetical protein
MFERNTEQSQPMSEYEASTTETEANYPLTVHDLIAQGFTRREVELLAVDRGHYLCGELNEWPEFYPRIRFARWLFEHGMIDG